MTDFRTAMARVDAKLDASMLSDEATLPSGALLRGRFFRTYTEHEIADGVFVGMDISFRCAATAEVLALSENELITLYSEQYRFVRRLPNRGDHVGRTIVELGTLL